MTRVTKWGILHIVATEGVRVKYEDKKGKKRIIKNYLSDTDPEDYVNHPKLPIDKDARV